MCVEATSPTQDLDRCDRTTQEKSRSTKNYYSGVGLNPIQLLPCSFSSLPRLLLGPRVYDCIFLQGAVAFYVVRFVHPRTTLLFLSSNPL